jgi:hypothetical protein
MPDADLEKSMDWFGGKNTERGILLFIVRHAAEHLGQSIAYARFVGITPPWTEDMQKKQPGKKEAAAPQFGVTLPAHPMRSKEGTGPRCPTPFSMSHQHLSPSGTQLEFCVGRPISGHQADGKASRCSVGTSFRADFPQWTAQKAPFKRIPTQN